MKIALGYDPNAIDFAHKLVPVIEGLGHEVIDFGSDDPIYAHPATRRGSSRQGM